MKQSLLSVMLSVSSLNTVNAMYSHSLTNSYDELKELEWASWLKVHGKTYETVEEHNRRYDIFVDNLDMIVTHNVETMLGKHRYTLNLNQFADMYTNEWLKSLSPVKLGKTNNVKYLNETDRDSVDWRDHGAVTPVKDQGQCGSCWSFSATGAMEGAWALSSDTMVSLSEQQLVDCSSKYGNMGCNGGLMDAAFEYVIDNGLSTEEEYPYTATSGTCSSTDTTDSVTFTSFVDVPGSDESQLKAAVALGPVSVAIEADQVGFQFYSSGVFSGSCGTNLDHGVLVVGYGTDSGQDYWIIKNSWAETWGDEGYIYLARNVDSVDGECGVAMMASYPIV
jgi:C1A family cysteine protease